MFRQGKQDEGPEYGGHTISVGAPEAISPMYTEGTFVGEWECQRQEGGEKEERIWSFLRAGQKYKVDVSGILEGNYGKISAECHWSGRWGQVVVAVWFLV